MARRDEDIGDWIEEEAGGGGLALAGWGFGSVVAFVLAFASWQYAPPRPAVTETARSEASLPDPSEITGSIASSERGQTTVQASRVVGATRVAPLPLAGNETVATSRDIDQLRSELRDIQRRIVQIGMAGDGMSRRVDRIDERLTTLASRDVAPPATANGDSTRTVEAAPVAPPIADKVVERLPTPQPKPILDPAPLTPPTAAFDADGPATTGAVPKVAATVPPTIDRPDASEAKPVEIRTVEAKPVDAKPIEAKPVETRPVEAKPVETKPTGKTARAPTAAPSSGAPMPLQPAAPAAPTRSETTARLEAALRQEAAARLEAAARQEAAANAARPAAPVAAPVAEAPPASEEPRPAPPVRIATATPAPAPAAQPAAVAPAPSSGQAAIDLGGYRSLASLRRSWSDMAMRHGDLSKGLEPLARLRETDSGIEARLLAGPFADQTEAAKACLRLKAAGATCAVTTFSGQPIGGLR